MIPIAARRRSKPGDRALTGEGWSRRRTGQTGIIIVILIFAGLFIVLAETGAYEGVVRNQLRGQVEGLFKDNVMIEDVLSAPCATKSRGVFYRSAVTSGDFDCLTPPGTMYLDFRTDSMYTLWAVDKNATHSTVRSPDEAPFFSQTLTVHLYDADDGSVEKAVMRVGAR